MNKAINYPKHLNDLNFLETLYSYKHQLFNIAEIKLNDVFEAEDAVSETILKACKKKYQLKDVNKLYYWVRKILINHCNDILRAKKRMLSENEKIIKFPLKETNDKPEYKYELEQEIEKVLDIMLTIDPEEHSEIVILYYYRKFSYEKIAQYLHIPVGTVKSRLNRAKSTLQKALKKEGITEEDIDFIKDLGQWPEIRLRNS